MKKPLAIKAGNTLIPIERVIEVHIDRIEEQEARIICVGGAIYVAKGFDAIEAVMLFKPSALEGRRLKWLRNAWAFHNLVAHPVMQLMIWFGRDKSKAVAYHDRTTPRPR